MSGFRGSHDKARKGPISQRDLVAALDALVDASAAKSASRTRDEARAALRWTLDNCNWNTAFVLNGIGARRTRFISRMGYPVLLRYLQSDDKSMERLRALNQRD